MNQTLLFIDPDYRMGPLQQFKFCRLCLCTSSSLSDIFDVENNNGFLVKDTIEDLLQFKVIRVHGSPWLTCDNCREKLHEFRLFKMSCIESKVAFENRYPQQIIMMPDQIRISRNPTQPPQALILLPIPHPPHLPPLANNGNPFQLTPSSLSGALNSKCNQIVMKGNFPDSWKPHVEEDNFHRTEECKINEDVLEPKVELEEFQPSFNSCEMGSGRSGGMMASEDAEIGIEEMDVKDFIPLENFVECTMGSEGDGNTETCEGEIEGHGGGLMNREDTNESVAETNCIRTEKLPVPVTTDDEGFITERMEENFSQVISGEQINCDSSLPCPVSSVSEVESFSCGELVNSETGPVNPVGGLGETDLSSRVDEELVTKLVCDSSRNSENISERPVSILEQTLSKCLSNSRSHSQAQLNPEFQKTNPHLTVNLEHQRKNILPGPNAGLADGRHTKHHECIMCNKRFESYDDLADHKLSHKGDPRPFKCPLCPQTYRNRKNQVRHQKIHYDVPLRFECEVCKAGFRFRHYLQRHLRSHKVKNHYPCKICGEVFKSSQVRGRHVAKHTDPKFPCPNCDKTFFLKSELNDHMLVHSDKKSFWCNVCGKGFTKPQYLRCHVQLHDEEKRHTCKECGAKFAQYSALWQHRKWHQGIKKFVCEVCNKGFVLNSQLRQHVKRHEKTSNRASRKSTDRTVDNADEKKKHVKHAKKGDENALVDSAEEADENAEVDDAKEADGTQMMDGGKEDDGNPMMDDAKEAGGNGTLDGAKEVDGSATMNSKKEADGNAMMDGAKEGDGNAMTNIAKEADGNAMTEGAKEADGSSLMGSAKEADGQEIS